jgi:O-antigen ligase
MRSINEKVQQFFILSLLVLLPFTSFPLVSRLFGGTKVAPLSAIPLLLLTPFLLNKLIKDPKLPSDAYPLYLFFLVAALVSALATFRVLPTFRDIAPWENGLEALLTLIVGIAFYLVPSFFINDERQLRQAIRWISLGGVIILVACIVQTISWLVLKDYPDILSKMQELVSSGRLYKRRLTGVALEPSWLAHQLNVLYLPLWLGLSFSKVSSFRLRVINKFTIENFLLLGGLTSLFLSFSRIGWLTFGMLVVYLIFHYMIERNRRLSVKRDYKSKFERLIYHPVFMVITLILLFVAISFLGGIVISKVDPVRTGKLFDLTRYKQFGILGWASQLEIAERIIYWMAAFKVYLMHPWLGVGLGGSGFYFPQTVNSFGYRLPEILRTLMVESSIPNAKNLWARLLSETGIIGFSLFITWMVVMWRRAQNLKSQTNTCHKAFSLIGKMFVIALLLEGFSIDTFGLPYYWISMGLITVLGMLPGLPATDGSNLKEQS